MSQPADATDPATDDEKSARRTAAAAAARVWFDLHASRIDDLTPAEWMDEIRRRADIFRQDDKGASDVAYALQQIAMEETCHHPRPEVRLLLLIVGMWRYWRGVWGVKVVDAACHDPHPAVRQVAYYSTGLSMLEKLPALRERWPEDAAHFDHLERLLYTSTGRCGQALRKALSYELTEDERRFCQQLRLNTGYDVDCVPGHEEETSFQHVHLCWPYLAGLGALCGTDRLWFHGGVPEERDGTWHNVTLTCPICRERLAWLRNQNPALLLAMGKMSEVLTEQRKVEQAYLSVVSSLSPDDADGGVDEEVRQMLLDRLGEHITTAQEARKQHQEWWRTWAGNWEAVRLQLEELVRKNGG